MKKNPVVFLEELYEKSMETVGSGESVKSSLPANIQSLLNEILENSESSKGVLTVVATSLMYKILHTEQDIRKHQSSISGGYSGRGFDSQFITPFFKKVRFPAMAESGWLTRSLEQKVPYDSNYTGAIRPESLKQAFLQSLDSIETGADCSEMLDFLFQGLIIRRNRQEIDLAKPANLPIRSIMLLLTRHFSEKYASEGASRLPVLALYAAYECLVKELKRFNGMTLAPIESHTTADSRSGSIGDMEITGPNGRPFEAVEVKHGIGLTAGLVRDAFAKFSTTQVNRYYLLSTNDIISTSEKEAISKEIERIKNSHGCQVIVNGLVKSLDYYLRLMAEPADFIDSYVNLLESDRTLKFEHKARWNELVSNFSG